MDTTQETIGALDRRVERRAERRDFFRSALGIAAVGVGGFAYASRAAAQSGPTDIDVLNFALNLEYLEAQFYSYALRGSGIDASLQTPGSSPSAGGAQGAVLIRSGETGQPRAVTFGSSADDRAVQQYLREIAADEVAHVRFLRSAIGNSTVAQPQLDISGGASGAFSVAARAAGLMQPQYAAAGIDANARTFDPYANSLSFLLAAFLLEDVGVSAYKGAARLIQDKSRLQAAAGILSVEANHSAIIRTTLYGLAQATPALITAVGQISDARDLLDGSAETDQGIAPVTINGQLVSNLVPTQIESITGSTNGIVLGRTPQQVLNVVYLNRTQVSAGGFYPQGLTGTVRQSNAN